MSFIIGFYYKCTKCGQVFPGKPFPQEGDIPFREFPSECTCGSDLIPEVQELKPPLSVSVFEKVNMKEKLV